jgi:hypothetical protein
VRLDVYELSRSPNGKSESTNVYKSVSDCCLTPTLQFLSYIMAITS